MQALGYLARRPGGKFLIGGAKRLWIGTQSLKTQGSVDGGIFLGEYANVQRVPRRVKYVPVESLA